MVLQERQAPEKTKQVLSEPGQDREDLIDFLKSRYGFKNSIVINNFWAPEDGYDFDLYDDNLDEDADTDE